MYYIYRITNLINGKTYIGGDGYIISVNTNDVITSQMYYSTFRQGSEK